jgi:hypothetical protein
MELANTLAYYDMTTIMAVKSFIVQAPGVKVLKIFLFINDVSTVVLNPVPL